MTRRAPLRSHRKAYSMEHGHDHRAHCMACTERNKDHSRHRDHNTDYTVRTVRSIRRKGRSMGRKDHSMGHSTGHKDRTDRSTLSAYLKI
ncbi:hypothetical protein RR48_13005 [Papilio machaon]|uniref:Uncharacterized protein n=1 Tax=Papilio machaon TaxID=76193 RepID=A0A194QXG4_PAPMA|nr:hypothetical protein RR48_13005 [Papilio machaon]